MTLTKTIRRREQRKRRRERLLHPPKPSAFNTPNYVIAEGLRVLEYDLRIPALFSRARYD